MLAGGLQWGRSDDWSSSEVVVEDGLTVGLENGFGGHSGSGEIEVGVGVIEYHSNEGFEGDGRVGC